MKSLQLRGCCPQVAINASDRGDVRAANRADGRKAGKCGFRRREWAGCGGLTAQSLPKLESPVAWERARRSLAESFHRALRDGGGFLQLARSREATAAGRSPAFVSLQGAPHRSHRLWPRRDLEGRPPVTAPSHTTPGARATKRARGTRSRHDQRGRARDRASVCSSPRFLPGRPVVVVVSSRRNEDGRCRARKVLPDGARANAARHKRPNGLRRQCHVHDGEGS
jgi:hypothetical protein